MGRDRIKGSCLLENVKRSPVPRKTLDRIIRWLFGCSGTIAALFILLIFFFILRKGMSVFLPSYEGGAYPLVSFLKGNEWRQDIGRYGVFFIVINTITSSLGALFLSFPISVLSALFIVKIAPIWLARVMATVVELLAAIPSIVYGVFAAGVIVEWVKRLADLFGQSSFGGNSLLAVSILLSIMVFPTMTSIAMAAIRAVPSELEEGALALGASMIQTQFRVVLGSARSGIFTGLILGLGRAFGEATAVSMVAGNAMAGPSVSPFDLTRTLTSTMLAGLKETHGMDYDIRFSVGVVLLLVILCTNVMIHYVKRRFGEFS